MRNKSKLIIIGVIIGVILLCVYFPINYRQSRVQIIEYKVIGLRNYAVCFDLDTNEIGTHMIDRKTYLKYILNDRLDVVIKENRIATYISESKLIPNVSE